MVTELRYVMLTREDVRAAIAQHVPRMMPALAGRAIDRVDIRAKPDDTIIGFIHFYPVGSAALPVESNFILSAILIHCRFIGVPIAARAEKRLEVSADGVALVTTINAWRRIRPRPPRLAGEAGPRPRAATK